MLAGGPASQLVRRDSRPPELPLCGPLWKNTEDLSTSRPPSRLGDAESYMSTEKSCFSLFLFFFIKTTTHITSKVAHEFTKTFLINT